MSDLLLSIAYAVFNPFVILACWLRGVSSHRKAVALAIGIGGGTFATVLALPLFHVLEAMEGTMAAGRFPTSLHLLAGGALASAILTALVWNFAFGRKAGSRRLPPPPP